MMHPRHLLLALVLTLAAALAFAQEPQRGGTLTVAVAQDLVTFDRMMVTAPPAIVRAHVFDGLFSFDENFLPQPTLVEDWEVSDDGLTWTFDLLQDVEFHDGTPMTAADVVASFDRYMRVGARAGEFDRVESWEAVDEHTVRFHMSSPWAAFTESLGFDAGGFAVYPAWLVEEWGADVGSSNFIGTGPYMVGEIIPEESYQLVRYENHRSANGPSSFSAGTRHAYVDEIVFVPIADPATRVSAILTGEVDIAFEVSLDDFARLEAAENVNVEVASPGARVYIKLNASQGPFADPVLRRALQTAIDLEDHMFVQGPEDLWRVNTAPRFQEGQWMWSPNLESYYPNDMERARELVAESDYDGEPVVLMGSPGRLPEFNIIPVLDQTLREMGLNVETVSYDAATFSQVRQDLSAWHIKHAGGPSAVPAARISSSLTDRTGTMWADFPVDEWDEHYAVLEESLDLDVRHEAVEELNLILGEYANEIWIGDVFALTACGTHVQNCPDTYALWLTDVWLDQ
ncbi:MAG: ABC transporter substrate-binding protein [Trueperaceae bacterium]